MLQKKDKAALTLTPIINIKRRHDPNVAVRGSHYATQNTRKKKQANEMSIWSASKVCHKYEWYIAGELIWYNAPCNRYAILEIRYNDLQGLACPKPQSERMSSSMISSDPNKAHSWENDSFIMWYDSRDQGYQSSLVSYLTWMDPARARKRTSLLESKAT